MNGFPNSKVRVDFEMLSEKITPSLTELGWILNVGGEIHRPGPLALPHNVLVECDILAAIKALKMYAAWLAGIEN